jgi:hypothetical protein
MGTVIHKAAPEGVFAVCRVEYETLGRSFRWLERRYGIGRTTLHHTAQMEGWAKLGSTPRPEGERLAQELEETILATGLTHRPPTAAMPLNPAIRRPNGRPRKHFRLSSKTTCLSNETPEVVGDPVSNEMAQSGTVANSEIAPATASVSSPDRPPEPVSDHPSVSVGWPGVKAAADRRTAEVIGFPIASELPKRMAGPVQLLPERTTEEKAKLRITLAAIRATMTVEQVQQLEHHEALLARYSHLIEVYLEPRRFVDVSGLSKIEAAEKIVATQKVALRMLLPTERDTLVGAIKVLTEAIARNITLKRSVAGLPTMGVFRPGDPANPLEDGEDPRGRLINLEGMDTAQLREVCRAMEALDRQQHLRAGAPVPPPPEPIDDLLDGLPKQLEEEPLPGSETPPR